MIYLNKNGSSAISTTLSTMFCIFLLAVFAVSIMQMLMPFLAYQKMQTVVVKYMYVIEKYGYLTKAEYNNLVNDVISCGIDEKTISIEYPSSPQVYGTLLKLKVQGDYTSNLVIWSDSISHKLTKTNLCVTKYSYSKI